MPTRRRAPGQQASQGALARRPPEEARRAPQRRGRVAQAGGILSSLAKLVAALATLATAVVTLTERYKGHDQPFPSPDRELRPLAADLATLAAAEPEPVITLHELMETTHASANHGVALSLHIMEARGPEPDRLNDLNRTIRHIRDEERRAFEQRCRPEGADDEDVPRASEATQLTLETSAEYNAHGLVSLLFSALTVCPAKDEKTLRHLRGLIYDIREGRALGAGDLLPDGESVLDRIFKARCSSLPDPNACHWMPHGLLLTASGLRLYYQDGDDTRPDLNKSYFLLNRRNLLPSLATRLSGGQR